MYMIVHDHRQYYKSEFCLNRLLLTTLMAAMTRSLLLLRRWSFTLSHLYIHWHTGLEAEESVGRLRQVL